MCKVKKNTQAGKRKNTPHLLLKSHLSLTFVNDFRIFGGVSDFMLMAFYRQRLVG
jgi:hypothetical protein